MAWRAIWLAAAIAFPAIAFAQSDSSSSDTTTPSAAQPAPGTMAPIVTPEDLAAPSQAAVSQAPNGLSGPAYLSSSDHALFVRAFTAANAGHWSQARALAEQGKSALARQLIEWRYLQEDGSGATFEDIDAFLRAHPGWPKRMALYTQAEKSMPQDLNPSAVVTWFGNREPASGFGEIRLGEALIAIGKRAQGADHIRHAWITSTFAPADEVAILARHGDLLPPDAQKDRLNQLLWSDDIGGAKRQLARVDSQTKRIADARMKMKANPRSVDQTLTAVSSALPDDLGLVFDAARAYRRSDRPDRAFALFAQAPTANDNRPDRWWDERAAEARNAVIADKYQIAYDLVSVHGLTTGADFTDGEFLAGWVALRYLNKPDLALKHFQTLADAVTFPISHARAYYWLGRTNEVRRDLATAVDNYRKAASDGMTFYGQLAQARIDDKPMVHLTNTTPDTRAARAAFERDERVQAMKILADVGETDAIRGFSIVLADEKADAVRLALVAETTSALGQPALAVKAAKQASYKNIALQSYLYPVLNLPRYVGNAAAPEPALVLGITRQESEFDTAAVSGAGAQGLMQLLPSSAKETAREHGLPYRAADLIRNPQYNLQVGMAHLADDIDDFGGSYILAIAAYNAGPNNVRKWMQQFGDPRDPAVDPIDWIETIPFSETRNYVQRVLENAQVYRSRLDGRDKPLTIMSDIFRPNAPKNAIVKHEAPAASSPPDSAPTRSEMKNPSSAVPTPLARPALRREAQQ